MGTKALVAGVVVVLLIVGGFAFWQYRKDQACDRWRDDYNRVQEAFAESPVVIMQVGDLLEKRPAGCPRPAGVLHDFPS